MARPLVRPQIDDLAPDVDLDTVDGDPWRLADRRGTTVLVVFHRHLH